MRFGNGHGFYELNPFPGCNQLVVSNHVYVFPHHRGQGVGKAQHVQRLTQARSLGYDYIMCTVVSTNERQINILKQNMWRLLDSFHNRETGNEIQIWGRGL